MIKEPKYICKVELPNSLWKSYFGDINLSYYEYLSGYYIVCVGIIEICLDNKQYTVIKPEYNGPSMKCPTNF